MRPGLDENVSAAAQHSLPYHRTVRWPIHQGVEVKLDIFAYTDSENMRPEPFKARFTPRSEKRRQILLKEAAEAREALRVYDGETKITMENVMKNALE